MATEETVTEDALTASLDDLIKVAGATSAIDKLKKGGQVFSGHNDERGKVGGGASPDDGSIETLMIGKLVAGGMDAAAASELLGFMGEQGISLGFMKEESEEEDAENEDGGNDGEEDMKGYARGYADAIAKMGKSEDGKDEEKLHKSVAEEFADDTEIQAGVDASPFLEALTAKTTEALGAISKSLGSQEKKQTKVNQALAKALYQVGGLVKSQSEVIDELGKRLGLIEKQPMPAKGARTAPQAKMLAKSFQTGGSEEEEKLTKSEAASAFSYLRFEKSIDTIEGERTGQLASMVEAGGTISEGASAYLTRWLAAHPNEKQAALSYR